MAASRGGHIEPNEHWFSALRRELSEEIGHNLFLLQGVLDIDSWADDKGGTCYGVTFFGNLLRDQVSLGSEHIEYAFVRGIDDMSKYVFWHDSIRKRIEAFLSKKNLLKEYDAFSK